MLPNDGGFSRSTLSMRLYEELKDKILDGVLEQGKMLDETLLSTTYNVSRNVVRDALIMLSESGLVTKEPHRTAIVRVFSERDICDLFDVRLALELLAIERGTFNDDAVRRLEAVLTMEERAVDEAVIKNYVKIDNIFHGTLVSLTANNALVDLFNRLGDQIHLARVVMTTRRPQRMAEAHSEHKMLVSFLSNGELSAARDILREHIEGAKMATLAGWRAWSKGEQDKVSTI
jgi:DNA-binding GntR family transcriptional regulator